MLIIDILTAVFLVAGTALMILSAFGLLRFGDAFMRMHAGTKASVLGIGCIIIGAAIHFSDSLITIKLLALGLLYFFTSPTGAHVLARGAHVARTPMVKETWIDELEASHLTDVDGKTAGDVAGNATANVVSNAADV